MRWYISKNGDTVGPVEGAEVIQLLRSGRAQSDSFFRDEASAAWVQIGQTPFVGLAANASAEAPAPMSPPTAGASNGGEGLGYAILATPLFGGLLIWLWIGNMNLFRDPAGALLVLSVVTILGTAVLMSVEASQLGMGTHPDSRGKEGTGPVAWFFCACLIWIVAFPWYLAQRKLYGRKSLVVGGVAVALFFVGSGVAVGSAVEAQKARVRASLSGFDSTLRGLSAPQAGADSSPAAAYPTLNLSSFSGTVASDAVDRYEIAKREGSAIDVCVRAAYLAAAFLHAKDEVNYQTWKYKEQIDCTAAGMRAP